MVENIDKAREKYALLSKQELISILLANEDGISVSFSGKTNARGLARLVRPRITANVSRMGAGNSIERPRNLVVEGDNLQAMVTLFKYRGKVDLIITDPPYNTGKDFRYNDRWDNDPNDPDPGVLVGEEDGARHTKWMKFMIPRISLMYDMLKPNGVLAICIDHRELFHLGLMLDEKFGAENRLAIINWQKTFTRKNDGKHVSSATEYVLVYAKDEQQAITRRLPRTAEMDKRFRSHDGDPDVWTDDRATAPSAKTHEHMLYGVQSPFTGKLHYPTEGRCWVTEKRKLKAALEEWGVKYVERDLHDGKAKALIIKGAPVRELGLKGDDRVLVAAHRAAKRRLAEGNWPKFFWGMNGEGVLSKKTYLKDLKKGVVPTTFWADEDDQAPIEIGAVSWEHEASGHSNQGIKELAAIVGPKHGFETVKPLKLFTKIIQLWSGENALVLDPFAGSGTTGHAILLLNALSGASRHFILIESGRPDRNDGFARTLTAKRLQRVISGNWHNGKHEALDGGFTFASLRDQIDAEAVLAMERSEMADMIVASYFDSNARGLFNLRPIAHDECTYVFAVNAENEGFFLVWNGVNHSALFTEEIYETIVHEARTLNLSNNYHVYARYNLFQSDDVTFYQIPNRILIDFGVNDVAEPFNNSSAHVNA